ncbi:MAG: hypothetical protein K2R98_19375 [Gemmataceae bacterium]|nr:hypothetical protein [Gemmataceae bacterium]
MGTRSIILITGKGRHGGKQTVRLYRHWDGYPTCNLSTIAEAIEKANELHQKYAMQSWSKDYQLTDMPAQTFADLVVASSIQWDGAAARIDDDNGRDCVWHEELSSAHYGNQGDLEWVYVVDVEQRTVKVYGNDYGTPAEHIRRGTVDPCKYAACLKPEYRDKERGETMSVVGRIVGLGWMVNRTGQAARKTKQLAW